MQGKKSRLVALAAAVVALAACQQEEAPMSTLDYEGTLAVDGAQLRYWVTGSGAPFFLLHGGPGIGVTYLLDQLDAPGFPPQGFRWIAYDQRGSGRSTGVESPDSITMERFVEDLEAFRQASGEERVGLLGHSFGGLLALSYAAKYPERVAAMILIDPDPASRELWEAHREIVEARTTESDRLLMSSITAGEGWETDPAQVESYHVARMQSYFGNRDVANRLQLGLVNAVYGNFPGTATLMRESLGDWDLFDEIQGLDVRTLIVTGDRSIFPAEAHERLAAALPRSELVVLPGVGHFPHMEDPRAFSEAVNRFLDRVSERIDPTAS